MKNIIKKRAKSQVRCVRRKARTTYSQAEKVALHWQEPLRWAGQFVSNVIARVVAGIISRHFDRFL